MTKQNFNSNRVKLIAAVVILGGGAGVWAITAHGKSGPTLPDELSYANLKAEMQKGDMRFMRRNFERKDLTDAQREQLRANMDRLWMEPVNEYFAAKSQDEKDKILDRQIDEWLKRRKKMEEERAKEDAKADKKDDAEKDKDKGPPRDWMKKMNERSPAQRKADSEKRNLNNQAKMMQYRADMKARADSRGVQLGGPFGGGPGGRGGPGGGGPRG